MTPMVPSIGRTDVAGRMLEKKIEDKVCQYALRKGIQHRKYVTPSHRSSPDRIFFPGQSRTFFIEFKQKGKKATTKQLREHRRLQDLGFVVYVCDNVEQGKRIIDDWAAPTK